MKKSKPRKHKSSKKKAKKKPHQKKSKASKKKTLMPNLSLGWKIFVGLSVILTVIGSIYSFSPEVEVYPYSSLNPLDPFATPFIIKNNSYLSIYDVAFSCEPKNVDASASHSTFLGGETSFGKPPIPFIDTGESSKSFCFFPVNFTSPITSADINILVSFRPSFIPWRQKKRFRFTTEKDINGKLVWLPSAKTETY